MGRNVNNSVLRKLQFIDSTYDSLFLYREYNINEGQTIGAAVTFVGRPTDAEKTNETTNLLINIIVYSPRLPIANID